VAQSMTAFSRVLKQTALGTLIWEVKSINHRYLEVSTRLPEKFRSAEIEFRQYARDFLERGKVDLTLLFEANLNPSLNPGLNPNLKDTSSTSKSMSSQELSLNLDLAKGLLHSADLLSKSIGLENNLKLDAILRWPGVLLSAEPNQDELILSAKEALKAAFLELQKNRTREGDKLVAQINSKLAQLAELIMRAREIAPRVLREIRTHLLTRLADLKSDLKVEISESRLEQELLFYSQRMDVTEELDRLDVHVSEAHRLLAHQGSIGRRFDFLLQEFNREANTLGSKSSDSDLTKIALDMKVLIEQIREQIQNIE
jgi:uncharacterized protein (TIGR00255 family)